MNKKAKPSTVVDDLQNTPPQSWRGQVQKALENIMNDPAQLKAEEIPSVQDQLKSLHSSIFLAAKKDPQKARGAYFELLNACYLLLFTNEVFDFEEDEELSSLQESLMMFVAEVDVHIDELLRQHPPKDVSAFSEDFANLYALGTMNLNYLETLSEVWGKKELDVVETYVEKQVQKLMTSLVDKDDDQTLDNLEMIKSYSDFFLLFKGELKDFISKYLTKEQSQDPDFLVKLAQELRIVKLAKSALICLQSIPTPKPSRESIEWYKMCDLLLRTLERHGDAYHIRWSYFMVMKDFNATMLFFAPWKERSDYSFEDPDFIQARDSLEKYIIEECDFEEGLDFCLLVFHQFMELSHILEKFMVHHLPHFEKYHEECFENIIEHDDIMELGDTYISPIATLLAYRELIRRNWVGTKPLDPLKSAGVPMSVEQKLNLLGMEASVGIQVRVAKEISKTFKKERAFYKISSHDEFMKSLKVNKRLLRSAVFSPPQPNL